MKNSISILRFALVIIFSLGSIRAQAQCTTPTSFSNAYTNSYFVNVSWNNTGADSYNIRCWYPGFDTGLLQSSSTNSKIFFILFCGNFNVEVQPVCGGTPGNWSSTYTFASPVPICINDPVVCNAPTGYAATYNTATNRYDLTWNAAGTGQYRIRMKLAGAGSWDTPVYITNNSYSPDLSSCSNYEYQVQVICSPNLWSNWSATQTFTPQTAPTGLSETNITNNSATLNWTAFTGAANYTISYRRVGQGWTVTTSTTNSKTLTGLSKNRAYEWKVRANCSGTPGPYSVIETFSTANNKMDDFIPAEIEFSVAPNPTQGSANLLFEAKTAGSAEVVVSDITGKIVKQITVQTEEGPQQLPLELEGNSPGLYFVKITLCGAEVHLAKLILNP